MSKRLRQRRGREFTEQVLFTRYSIQFAASKERKAIAQALKPIYGAVRPEAVAVALEAFEQGRRGQKYPPIVARWHRKWEQVILFFTLSAEFRQDHRH